jgi:hypothetical protein
MKLIGIMRELEFNPTDDAGFVDFGVNLNDNIGRMQHPQCLSFFPRTNLRSRDFRSFLLQICNQLPLLVLSGLRGWKQPATITNQAKNGEYSEYSPPGNEFSISLDV